MQKVAALYIDPNGPYPKMKNVDAWDVERDAAKYMGPYPIIVHPPCGPWGKLRKFCTKQDPSLAIIAVHQLIKWGGVLEHPVGSLLWEHMNLPRPDEPPKNGLRTFEVEQCRWGHRAHKKTWLLTRGLPEWISIELPEWQEPTHCVDTRSKAPDRLIKMSKQERARTPKAFAEFLYDLASRCSV